MFKNFIFDLDGTLIDTLPDIVIAINEALEECGFPFKYDYQSGKRLIGDGANNLIHRALGNLDNEENFQKLKKAFMPLYKKHQGNSGGEMKNALEALSKLKEMGSSLFVLTNKPNHLVKDVLNPLFGIDMFTFIKGLKEGETPKPDIHNILSIIDGYNLSRDETLYVGDSYTDYLTAKNGKIPFCLCLYGYGNYSEDFLSLSDYHINDLNELIGLAK